MIEKIDYNQIQDLLGKSPSRRGNPAEAAASIEADASLQMDYAVLINKAMQAEQSHSDQVAEAKKLLASGELDSAENIRTAAEEIVTFGI